jgi:hypothetical protein
MALLLKNLLFTLLVPGTVAVYVPLLIARGRSITSGLLLLIAGVVLIGLGAASSRQFRIAPVERIGCNQVR